MIELGAKEFLNAVLKTPGISEYKKNKARKLYQSIIFTAFDWQRSGLVDELAKKEDEDIRQRTDQGLPTLPREEIEKMVNKLSTEMEAIVKKQEFERAAQIRDRIVELKRYAADVSTPIFEKESSKEWD